MTLDRDQIARRKRVVVHQSGDHVHEEQIVQDVNLEYREALYRVSQLIWLLFGVVLLRNENNLLPLSKDIRKIAVLGPNANNAETQLGNYNGQPSVVTTVLQ